MSTSSLVQPALLSKINEQQVLRTIQALGPLSRAEVARHSGISAPTASRAVEALLRAGLLEEADSTAPAARVSARSPRPPRGRPARRLRLASRTAQVLGFVIDAGTCMVVAAGLDGEPGPAGPPGYSQPFPTPGSYDGLLAAAEAAAQRLINRDGLATLGMAVSMPGLVDYRDQRGVLSPNLPITDGRSPSRDLAERLGIDCVMVQESHALCLAERYFGDARGLDDFGLLDVTTGIGLGIMSGGQLLTGHSGLAGEVGHVTVDPDGRRCGCGNRGCLETVASDSAVAAAMSERLGRRITVDELADRLDSGALSAAPELERACRYLAIGLAAVINLFNPSHLFVHGRLFAANPELFARLVAATGDRALPPSFAGCQIRPARASKRGGVVAAMIEHLTNAVVPARMAEAAHRGNGNGAGEAGEMGRWTTAGGVR